MTPSAQIIEVLDYLGQKIGITIDWTQANIMPYLQELFHRFITYEIAKTTVDIVLVTAFLIAACLCIKPFKKSFKNAIDTDEVRYIAGTCVFAGIIIIGIVCFLEIGIDSIYHLIECLTIPEKTLYDYIVTLMK